jgi:methionyl-tRNA formyltransferase
MQNVRVGFVTCVELGLACAQEIIAAGGSLHCMLTLHDHIARRKAGRVYIDDFCAAQGIPLFKLRNINDADAVEFLRQNDLDWLFIIGWSQIAHEAVLAAPRLGVLGAHPTLLPVGRGRASIPWAIVKRLPHTGVTLFQLDSGVDTGPILEQVTIPIASRETATTLYAKVADAHRTLIRSAWPAIANGTVVPRPQDHAQATEWPGRTPEDGRLDLSMTLDDADLLVRAATHPYPGAFIDLPEGRLRVWSGEPLPRGAVVPPGAVALEFSGGTYVALDHALEQAPAESGRP